MRLKSRLLNEGRVRSSVIEALFLIIGSVCTVLLSGGSDEPLACRSDGRCSEKPSVVSSRNSSQVTCPVAGVSVVGSAIVLRSPYVEFALVDGPASVTKAF